MNFVSYCSSVLENKTTENNNKTNNVKKEIIIFFSTIIILVLLVLIIYFVFFYKKEMKEKLKIKRKNFYSLFSIDFIINELLNTRNYEIFSEHENILIEEMNMCIKNKNKENFEKLLENINKYKTEKISSIFSPGKKFDFSDLTNKDSLNYQFNLYSKNLTYYKKIEEHKKNKITERKNLNKIKKILIDIVFEKIFKLLINERISIKEQENLIQNTSINIINNLNNIKNSIKDKDKEKSLIETTIQDLVTIENLIKQNKLELIEKFLKQITKNLNNIKDHIKKEVFEKIFKDLVTIKNFVEFKNFNNFLVEIKRFILNSKNKKQRLFDDYQQEYYKTLEVFTYEYFENGFWILLNTFNICKYNESIKEILSTIPRLTHHLDHNSSFNNSNNILKILKDIEID